MLLTFESWQFVFSFFFSISCIRYVVIDDITLENHNNFLLEIHRCFHGKRKEEELRHRRDCEMITSLRVLFSSLCFSEVVVSHRCHRVSAIIYRSFRPSSKRFSLANIKYKSVILSSFSSLFFHL